MIRKFAMLVSFCLLAGALYATGQNDSGAGVEGPERLDIGSPEYLELSRKIYAFHAANLYMIGTVGMTPTLYIAKNSIGNVPTAYPPPRPWAGDLTAYADHLFIKR